MVTTELGEQPIAAWNNTPYHLQRQVVFDNSTDLGPVQSAQPRRVLSTRSTHHRVTPSFLPKAFPRRRSRR